MINRIGRLLAGLAWFDELDFEKALRVVAWAKREKLPLEAVIEEGMKADLVEYAKAAGNSEEGADDAVNQLLEDQPDKQVDNVVYLSKAAGE